MIVIEPLLVAAVLGFTGGVAHSVMGLLKLYVPKKKGQLKPAVLAITLIGSGLIGLFAALTISTSYPLALLAGYAGMDFIESIYKIRVRGKTLTA